MDTILADEASCFGFLVDSLFGGYVKTYSSQKGGMQPGKIRLPRLVEQDPRGAEVLRVLTTQSRPLWSGGTLRVSAVKMASCLVEALRSAERSGRVIRGLESAERALAAEERGIRLARGGGNRRPDVRFSRLLLLADDGAERFYRHVETLLRRHGSRVLAVRLDVDARALGELLFGPGQRVRLVMIIHKNAVSAILLAMTGQEEGCEGGRVNEDNS
jgi:hypothetical protein